MHIGPDIFVGASPSPVMLRTGIARAFGLPIERVAIRQEGEAWPAADLVIEIVDAHAPGDYPLQLIPWMPDPEAMGKALARLARELGVPVLTASDSVDPRSNDLFLADGSLHEVFVDQDEDGGIRNTASMRRLIADSYTAPLPLAS